MYKEQRQQKCVVIFRVNFLWYFTLTLLIPKSEYLSNFSNMNDFILSKLDKQ